jgi:rubrerythrin
MDKILVEQVFRIAIDREIEAHEFYTKVAASADNADVRGIFEQLSKDEMGHMRLLEKLKNDPTKMMKISAPEVDYKVAEAKEFPRLSTDMKPADAIQLAMKKEQQAVEFYRHMAELIEEPELQDMFTQLSNMELGHKHRLENVFAENGYPEVF